MPSFAAIRIAPLVMLLILYYGSCSCKATDAQLCSRWCGVHNISHPFRLKDSPDKCGDNRYTLSCEDNQLMLYLKSIKYYVQSINYNNYTIRVVDVNLRRLHYPSLPPFHLILSFFMDDGTYRAYADGVFHYHTYLYPRQFSFQNSLMKTMLYVSCPNGVESSGLYVDDSASCMNSSYVLGNSFYLHDGNESLWDLGLPDSCRIEFISLTSWPGEMANGNVSCGDIHEMLLYGFELSWVNSLCEDGGYLNHWRLCVPSGLLVNAFTSSRFILFIYVTDRCNKAIGASSSSRQVMIAFGMK